MTNDDLKRLFGLRVQTLRRRLDLTQEQLAEVIGKTVETVSNIERGSSSTRLETAAAIADALKVTLPELFEFEGATALAGDRDRRRLIEQMVMLLLNRDTAVIQHVAELVRVAVSLAETAGRR